MQRTPVPIRPILPASSLLACCTAALVCLSLPQARAQTPQADDTLRLNQIQIIGTHNSYHAGLPPHEKTWLEKENPHAAAALDYSHPPLTEQFEAGVRQIELDVYADTEGGRYAHPRAPALVAAAGLPADPPEDPDGVMLKPGFKVMHVQDIDQRSRCQPFVACLREVRAWSEAHPGHVPLFILVETKQGASKEMRLTTPEPFTPAVFDALDAEIRSVFSASEMITPDDVRGPL